MHRTKPPSGLNGHSLSSLPAPTKRRRNVAHLWADKRVLRFIRKRFQDDGQHSKHLLLVYIALCQIDSDFGEGVEIKSFTKTVATYSHLHDKLVGQYLKAFQKAGMADYPQHQEETPSGPRFGAKTLELYEWIDSDADQIEEAIRRALRLWVQPLPGIVSVVAPTASGSSHQGGSTHPIKNTSYEVSKDIEDARVEDPIKIILGHWNSSSEQSGLPKVVKLTASRRSKLAARIKDYGIKDVRKAIRAIHKSEFCRGENDNGWRASLDFLIRPDTVAKAMEGLYDNRKPVGRGKIAGRKVRHRNGNRVVLEGGEPIYLDRWSSVLSRHPDTGERFEEGDLWASPDRQRFVFCPFYPEPRKGEMHIQAIPADPEKLGLMEAVQTNL